MINWIQEKFKHSLDSKLLFEEAIKCYKIEAFRASLLFSYLGFLNYIKEMIIGGKQPINVDDTRWEKIIRTLNDENFWEERVFNELTNSSNSAIFRFNDSIKEQIKYWRGRRNDCAHFKDNDINFHHTEMFWSFLRSNLTKISLEGSKQNLLNKFCDFFDRTKTSTNASPDILINEIEDAVEYSDLKGFFTSIKDLQIIGSGYYVPDEDKQSIFFKILSQTNNKRILSELILFIKSQVQNYDLKFILEFPTSVNSLNYNTIDIRNIWKVRVWMLGHTKYNILLTLFRNGKIPAEEIEEFYKDIFQNFNQTGYQNLNLDDNSKKILFNNNTFHDVVSEILFVKGSIYTKDYSYINSKEELITLLFLYKDLNKDMIEGLKKMVENEIRPNWLQSSLTALFNGNEDKKKKVLEIATTLNCEQSFVPS